MDIVVLKFGGTSLDNNQKILQVISHIKGEISNGNKVICIVSAMGRDKPYSTNTLKSLVSKIPPKYTDRLISIGETISSLIVFDNCIKNNISTDCLEYNKIGIITDSNFNDANILTINEANIVDKLNNYDCLVVPGFQGMDPFSNITTLGRGGSDTSAIAIGTKLDVKKIEIISDVKGIYSADPKIVKDAILYNELSYDELLKITINGASVLHEKAAFIANLNKTPLIFRKLGDSEIGTRVIDEDKGIFNLSHKKSIKVVDNKMLSRLSILNNSNVYVSYVEDDKINEVIVSKHSKLKKDK